MTSNDRFHQRIVKSVVENNLFSFFLFFFFIHMMQLALAPYLLCIHTRHKGSCWCEAACTVRTCRSRWCTASGRRACTPLQWCWSTPQNCNVYEYAEWDVFIYLLGCFFVVFLPASDMWKRGWLKLPPDSTQPEKIHSVNQKRWSWTVSVDFRSSSSRSWCISVARDCFSFKLNVFHK